MTKDTDEQISQKVDQRVLAAAGGHQAEAPVGRRAGEQNLDSFLLCVAQNDTTNG
jgi:hypothetical protein